MQLMIEIPDETLAELVRDQQGDCRCLPLDPVEEEARETAESQVADAFINDLVDLTEAARLLVRSGCLDAAEDVLTDLAGRLRRTTP